MDNQVQEAIQTQFNNERYNAQVYFTIADMFENMAYDGFALWFRKQAQGELEHAHKFAEFLISKRVQPRYETLGAIVVSVSNDVVDLASAAYTREIATTHDLEVLYNLADDNNVPQVCALLDWFLVEQIEEETWSFDLYDLVSGTDKTGWIVLDKEYGSK